jgi:low temperature requirement protein LtrA
VFVFGVTQVVGLVHGHLDLATAGSALLVFWLVWWAWTQFTWALNAANTDHPRIQIATLVATAVAFFMAVAIPRALGPDSPWFAAPYVLVRVVGLVLYYWVAWGDPAQRRAVRVFGLFSLTGLLAVAAGSVLGGTALLACWAAAVALDLLAAGIGGQLEGWNLHPEHFVERHGLIVIIALGETLIVAAAGMAGAPDTTRAAVTAVLVVAVTCGLWWSYFPGVKPALEHALARAEGNARSCMARDVFSVIHFPMLCGVIAFAVAAEEALARPGAPLAPSVRGALAAGVLLFVGGGAVALWRGTGRPHAPRWGLAASGAATVLLLPPDPWVAMGAIVVVLAALGMLERPFHASGG